MTLPQIISLIALLIALGSFVWSCRYTRPKKSVGRPFAGTEAYVHFIKSYVETVIVHDLLAESEDVEEYYVNANALAAQLTHDYNHPTDVSTRYTNDMRLYARCKNADLNVLIQTTIMIITNYWSYPPIDVNRVLLTKNVKRSSRWKLK